MMRKIIILTLVFITLSLNAQHSISGTFSPAKEYTWLIAYQLLPGSQNYIVDSAISNGKFTLKMPPNATPGTYRLVYAVPQEEFYFDVIYNGKEDFNLTFNYDKGVEFTTSQENILFGTYFTDINAAERSLINFFAEGKTDVTAFLQLTQNMSIIQNSYEKKSQGLLVNEFITANRPYVPKGYESIHSYVRNKKLYYFENLDLNNPVLQASRYLNEKLINYAFTALPIEVSTNEETETHIEDNIATINQKIEAASDDFKFYVLHSLLTQANLRGLENVSDIVLVKYLKAMVTTEEQKELIATIEAQKKLRIGAMAPEISWKSGDTLKNLSSFSDVENYVLIFWSSTCAHCLKELPPLHKKLKDMSDVKVVAIGLEDDKTTWTPEASKLNNFEHAIALGRWESEYAKTYNIHRTPTYFILDVDKRIIAKPETDREVIEFLERL